MLSVLDIFQIGIGPSSSHTMGPMNAARRFVAELVARDLLERTRGVFVELYGSLGLKGRVYCTDRAVLLGLEGRRPDMIDPAHIEPILARIRATKRLCLAGRHEIEFHDARDLRFARDEVLPAHPNGMRFTALDVRSSTVHAEEFYSVGGGCVLRGAEIARSSSEAAPVIVRFPFETADDLLRQSREHDLQIHQLVRANEHAWRNDGETRDALLRIWQVMDACIERGFNTFGVLPGVHKVERRAPELRRQLTDVAAAEPMKVLDWVSAFAIAVSEENAAGGRVVAAPTHGAAGIVPALLAYYRHFESGAHDDGILRFLLVAGAIAFIYKRNASGAEVGCQGAVGVACSMAAAGLAAALGGTNEQIEHAAVLGMEHHLGLTCDPVASLIQIPWIERNAMGAVKAMEAARLALRGNSHRKISLDQVIATMRHTGRDMKASTKKAPRRPRRQRPGVAE